MTLTKNERGYYEVRVKGADGKIKSFSTHKKNKDEARQVIKASKIAELEEAAKMGLLSANVISVLLAGKRMSIEEAIEPWEESMRRNYLSPMSIANTSTWVKSFAQSQGLLRVPLHSLKPEDIDRWVNHPDGMQKASTRGIMLSALRSFFRFCSDSGWIVGNPANLVSVNMDQLLHGQKEATPKLEFSEEEIDQLLRLTRAGAEKESSFWHAAIAIGYCTGLRLGDICTLEWASVTQDFELVVWTKKRDKRVKPFTLAPNRLQEALKGVDRGETPYLFPEQRQIVLTPSRRAQLSSYFARLCSFSGILGKSFHSFRHYYVRELARQGTPIQDISTYVGHSQPGTTEGYLGQG
jgi:integrase